MICAKIKIRLAFIVDFLMYFWRDYLIVKNHYEVLSNVVLMQIACIQLASIAYR